MIMQPHANELISYACRFAGISNIAENRKNKNTQVRMLLAYLIHTNWGLPYQHIAVLLYGRKDHSTVLHAIQRVRDLIAVRDTYVTTLLHQLQPEAERLRKKTIDQFNLRAA
jgi:chromosomal replication initiation ATPase DnaA